MAPISSSTNIMTILTTITSISSAIFGSSSVTFVNDTQAYTTVNINLSQVTNITSWCPYNILGPFTVNTVT
jgi:hypothetical protein